MAHDLYNQVSLNGKPKSIRILQLSTAQTTRLEGHLKEVSLSSNPTYYALSYNWGDSSDPPHQVLCHASISSNPVSAYIKITDNCYDALTQLRKDLAPRGRPLSFNIWVDAICIDQTTNGTQEKLAQIPLMREIYAKSERVYIWLGLETESSNDAMDWIRGASLGKHTLSAVKFRYFPANMVCPSELVKLLRMTPELIKGGTLSRHLVCLTSKQTAY
jgi:Heterokaryon incompatibility protein (HET)